jgi:hypothetical protein
VASTILSDNGVTSGSAGLKTSADSTGVLALQTTTAGGTATTAVTIDTSQNVIVGTGSTTIPLTVTKNPSSSSSSLLYLNPSTGTNASLIGFNNSGSGGLNIGRSDSAGAGSGTTITAYDSFVATTGTTGLSFHTNNTRAMYIDSGQNVGIGTTSPTRLLDVTTTGVTAAIAVIQNTSTASAQLRVKNPQNESIFGVDTSTGGLTGTANATYIYTGNYPILFSPNGTERGRFTSGGFFKASSEGSYLTSASHHELRGAGVNSYELVISNTSASPASEYITDIRFTANTPNNGNARFLACTDPTNEKAAILSSGGFLSRNNSYGTYSDIKLKENVVNASPKLADVMRLQVRNFNFKTNPEEKQIGFIAQEFEQVFPAMVDESQDRAQDGTVLDETTKSIKTSVLIPILVKAIQELKAINDTQAETINALTARIVALESK